MAICDIMEKRGTWDIGLDYKEAKNLLLKKLEHYRNKKPLYQRDKIAYAYLLIGLIQLRNGCRVGEAIEGLIKIIQNGDKEVKVRVEKRKDDVKRLIVLPEELTTEDLKRVEDVVNNWEKSKKLVVRISTWYKDNLNINTHSLRYAFISYLGKKGVPAQLIAHITGHATLDMIMRYTQAKIAEEILRKLE
jgi:integrase